MRKSKAKSIVPQLPAGFKAVVGGSGNSWRPNTIGETIQGVMGAPGVVKFPKRGKKPAQDVPEYTIRTKDGDVRVLESAGLRALGKVKKGREVFIQFLGLKQIKVGQSPMRDYLVATK